MKDIVTSCTAGSIYTLPPCRNALYLDALFRRRQLGHVVERIEQRTAGPRLRPAAVVAVRAVLVRQLGQASPRVTRDVRAVAGQVLVDVVESRSRVGATGAGEGIKGEVGAEEVACFGTREQVRNRQIRDLDRAKTGETRTHRPHPLRTLVVVATLGDVPVVRVVRVVIVGYMRRLCASVLESRKGTTVCGNSRR